MLTTFIEIKLSKTKPASLPDGITIYKKLLLLKALDKIVILSFFALVLSSIGTKSFQQKINYILDKTTQVLENYFPVYFEGYWHFR